MAAEPQPEAFASWDQVDPVAVDWGDDGNEAAPEIVASDADYDAAYNDAQAYDEETQEAPKLPESASGVRCTALYAYVVRGYKN